MEPYIKYKSDEFFEKCEHINFNSYFNCAIYTPWEVESPKEHLEYKNLNFLNKLRYIFASFIGDVKNIFFISKELSKLLLKLKTPLKLENMYKIKVSLKNEKNNLNIKDFVDNRNTYKNFKFYVNEDTEEVDYWFIVENVLQNHEETKVNKKNIIYLNYETSYPKDYFLTKYMKSYLGQFSKKYGCYNDFSDNYVSSTIPALVNKFISKLFFRFKL